MDGAGGIGGGAGTVTARVREPPAQQGAGAPGLADRLSALGAELELLDKEHAALLATVQRLVVAPDGLMSSVFGPFYVTEEERADATRAALEALQSALSNRP
jgi:hypothetical protein